MQDDNQFVEESAENYKTAEWILARDLTVKKVCENYGRYIDNMFEQLRKNPQPANTFDWNEEVDQEWEKLK